MPAAHKEGPTKKRNRGFRPPLTSRPVREKQRGIRHPPDRVGGCQFVGSGSLTWRPGAGGIRGKAEHIGRNDGSSPRGPRYPAIHFQFQ